MTHEESHLWVRHRLAAWRAGLLEEAESTRVDQHLATCAACRALADAWAGRAGADAPAGGPAGAPAAGDAGMHIAASLVAEWPRAQRALRGIERALVRRHLERCVECRQDLETLGYEPRLEFVADLEADVAALAGGPRVRDAHTPAAGGPARIIRIETAARRATMRDRALIAWASVASIAAVLLLVSNVRGVRFEGGSSPLFVPGSPVWTRAALPQGPFSGLSLRIEPPPRSLSGPSKGSGEGKLNVIPIVGPLTSLALGFKPLNVPDTSLVTVSLLDAGGDTLYAVSYRQWEFRPKRCLVIDRAAAPLTPGQYALVLGSQIAKAGEEIEKTARYRFELRSKQQVQVLTP